MSFLPPKLLARTAYISKTVKLIWSAARYWMLGWWLLLLIQGLIPIVTVYLTRWLVDNLTIAIGQGNTWSNLEIIILPASLMASILLLAEVLKGIGLSGPNLVSSFHQYRWQGLQDYRRTII